MTLSVQQAHSQHQTHLQKLRTLKQQHDKLATEKQARFLKLNYFPELVESFFCESIFRFELRFPLGNDAHEKAYFATKFEEMNHFF
jgi:hypothetical protein